MRRLDRDCGSCLQKQGLRAFKRSLNRKARAKRLSQAAEIRRSVIEAEELAREEEKRKRRNSTGGIEKRGESGKIGGARGCVIM
ncbi:hypothetical protein SBOR_0888 [Sclerotinia borealis F-4128]|uniref:Uncharacterized protein n=1 Tax=Sclerotinia borealis (strain F-4128) TaxID=1432307 RepID=W9CVS4_SCLBF|nr:hypothetical protein SBOR_0888 [Sclerotinia borealis F-4128]